MRNTPLPESIGRFPIQEVLGRGGMGEVYKAFDPTLQRTVAVKTVRPDIGRPEYLERMMREAQACARLSHPNIVTVYEAGQVDGRQQWPHLFDTVRGLDGNQRPAVCHSRQRHAQRVESRTGRRNHPGHDGDLV